MKKIILTALLIISLVGYVHAGMIIQTVASGTDTISFRSSSGTYDDAGYQISITMPSGTADGDIMIASITDDAAESVTAPGGWTLIDRAIESTYLALSTFYRVASSDTGPFVFEGTTTDSRYMVGTITTFQKTGGTWDIEDYSNNTEAVANSITTTSVTATDNSMLLCTFANDDSETVTTPPADMTLSNSQIGVSTTNDTYYESRSSGAVTKSITWGGGTEQLAAIAIVLDLVP